MSFLIEACHTPHAGPWLRMRQALWPHEDAAWLAADIELLLADASPRRLGLIALTADGQPIGFAEASIRRGFVNGCDTTSVAFLEGIYVEPDQRRRGIARALCGAVQAWGKTWDCTEFASDAFLDDEQSHRMHAALGFKETERVVYFRKVI